MSEEKNKRVLVVEDDENLRMVLRDKLVVAGFDVEEAINGEEGLKKALEIHPDVILLDVVMPKMDGWETLGKLREDKWGNHANVIVLTVVENKEEALGVAEGKYQYMLKTDYNLDDIVDRVKNLMNKKASV